MTMMLPVQTADARSRGEIALTVEVGVQVSVVGSYCPPVFSRGEAGDKSVRPPHTTIRVPVHTAVWLVRDKGALLVDVGDQVSVVGSYRPPVLRNRPPWPPHTTMRLPVQIASWSCGVAREAVFSTPADGMIQPRTPGLPRLRAMPPCPAPTILLCGPPRGWWCGAALRICHLLHHG